MDKERLRLSVEVPEDINPTHPVNSLSPELIETSMSIIMIFDNQSVSVAAEWSISWKLTVANLVISTFRDVEIHGTVSSNQVVTHTITPRSILWNTAWTPLIYFSFLQIHVIREITSNQRNTSGSISSFLVWDDFWKRNNFLVWKISNIIRLLFSSWCRWLKRCE